MDIKRIECPHCEGKGICKADNDCSCGTCLKAAKVKKDTKVVRCDVCMGVGKAEPKTERLIARMPFLIVIVVLGVFYFYALINAANPDKFDQIFPLIGSLTTMIVTFYFSRK
ncbi:MAG: hypothetical protein HUJ13_05345 [Hydrogenovibrio crunogenus]|nr:hypothetical protein [Hydrogenovibrio crunogenus]